MKSTASALPKKEEPSLKKFFLKATPLYILTEALLVGLVLAVGLLSQWLVPPLHVPTHIQDPRPNAPVMCGNEVMNERDVCGTYYRSNTTPLYQVSYEQARQDQSQQRIEALREKYQDQVDDQKNNLVWVGAGLLDLLIGFFILAVFIAYFAQLSGTIRRRRQVRQKAE